jgi:tetratricopeptide (TPR) repeat protein
LIPIDRNEAKARIPELERLCLLRPNSLSLADLGANYFTANRPHEALECLLKAWDKNHQPSIAMNLALTLKDLGRHDEAFHYVEQAYFLAPEDQYIRLGYAEALLKNGFWQQAWPLYDHARPTQLGAALNLNIPLSVKEWDGGPLPPGHLLLVINEGGNGDRLSYPRWLPELTRRGINWRFYPYSELFPFFERIFPRDKLIADGEDIPNPTHWCTTFSLPAKLNAVPTDIPAPLPITADPKLIDKYQLNRSNSMPVLGLCYQAAELFQGGRRVRSLSEGQAMRLVCSTMDKIAWVSLQYGEVMPAPVANVQMQTWQDTAALIHQLDGVVTVDTGIYHLAGAMGKPTAVVLGGNACWKFFRSGQRDRWYPTSRLYRNDGHGLENAVSKLIAEIRDGFWPQTPCAF